ncbi:hypothetical protein PFICI_03015 [Pestalotiopsis fici W106-1]|uniref:Uncharacterized protein n=1 Tax=Pestalotiopsis fici (strain W106-1 / CGMCC3.15140) TaxID=1229662 RepID=W3XG30_PESFW|nr:uncharacterized protein PFICI_03015 [Pestalotiopsis fici W106-1]ETS84990.1 hypothetical protein PFICI_03015 [Pestalotiopsis fici W106-1]
MPKTSPRPDGLNTAAPQPAQATQPAKRFQLPALNLSLGSLTEGTDIPPPIPSPVQEVPTPPKTPPADDAPKKTTNGAANVQTNGLDTSPKSDVSSSTNGGLKRPVDQGPVSPTYSSRGSLRRYLSKNLLHNAYDEQASISSQVASRPPSRTASVAAEERKAKRGSGWFRRLRSNDSKRNSMQQFEEVHVEKKGPPPPTIPEMSAFKIDTAIGDDLFKEIK